MIKLIKKQSPGRIIALGFAFVILLGRYCSACRAAFKTALRYVILTLFILPPALFASPD